MEKLKVSKDENFREKVNEYIGQIAFVKYYDDQKEQSIIEQGVISEIRSGTHLYVIQASENALLKKGLYLPKVECVFSSERDEVLLNPDYNIEETIVIKK